MKKIKYNGESKVIRRIVELLNKKPETGEGHEDAYFGDFSKAAYEHSLLQSGNPHNVTLEDLGIADIFDKLAAFMQSIGMMRDWITHDDDTVVDHDGTLIQFQGAAEENQNYLLWH